MKRRRHSPEQVIRKLAEGEKLQGQVQGQGLAEVCQHTSIGNLSPGEFEALHIAAEAAA